ncbi:MAG: sporulation membrane protein YtaF [Epulopiscium sp.]|jgi:putative sporulation protein YtaF|nr:sporulation membrane protein YtaF [Candidatus Epulonipiscium sp.]
MIFILLLAISLSIDALGIGITYGVRDIAISFFVKCILAVESAALMAIFLIAGDRLTLLLSPKTANLFGVIVLLCMGLWLCLQCFIQLKHTTAKEDASTPMDMLRTPTSCDRNHSSTLEPKEAMTLSFILSIDSLGAGIGAGAAGISISLLPICVALCQTLFISMGVKAGKKLNHISPFPEHLWSAVSGILLIIIALFKLNLKL